MENEVCVGTGLRPSAKAEDVTDETLADYSASRLEAGFAYWILLVAMKKYCFVWDAACYVLEDLYKLETCFALSGKVSTVLADFSHSTCSVHIQTASAQNVFLKNDTENAVSSMSSVIGTGPRGHVFCSHVVFFCWSRSFFARMERVKNVEAGRWVARKRALHVSEVDVQILLYTRSPRVYSRDPRRANLFHPSVSNRALHF